MYREELGDALINIVNKELTDITHVSLPLSSGINSPARLSWQSLDTFKTQVAKIEHPRLNYFLARMNNVVLFIIMAW